MGDRRRRFSKGFVEELQETLNNVGITYPFHTLRRRLGLLTQAERRELRSSWKELQRRYERAVGDFYDDNAEFIGKEIDLIISERAEKKGDPWP